MFLRMFAFISTTLSEYCVPLYDKYLNIVIMKKIVLLLLIFATSTLTQAQTLQYYLYNIVTFSDHIDREGIKVEIDNGQKIEIPQDANGKKIYFKTPAAVLNYFASNGWELYKTSTYASNDYNKNMGQNYTDITTCWIMRKPCTKDELDKTSKEGLTDKRSWVSSLFGSISKNQ